MDPVISWMKPSPGGFYPRVLYSHNRFPRFTKRILPSLEADSISGSQRHPRYEKPPSAVLDFITVSFPGTRVLLILLRLSWTTRRDVKNIHIWTWTNIVSSTKGSLKLDNYFRWDQSQLSGCARPGSDYRLLCLGNSEVDFSLTSCLLSRGMESFSQLVHPVWETGQPVQVTLFTGSTA